MFKKIDDYRWLIPKKEGMRVPGLIYANERMLKHIEMDRTPCPGSQCSLSSGDCG